MDIFSQILSDKTVDCGKKSELLIKDNIQLMQYRKVFPTFDESLLILSRLCKVMKGVIFQEGTANFVGSSHGGWFCMHVL